LLSEKNLEGQNTVFDPQVNFREWWSFDSSDPRFPRHCKTPGKSAVKLFST